MRNWEATAEQIGRQQARYLSEAGHKCDACHKLVKVVTLVQGRIVVPVKDAKPKDPVVYRSRQVCKDCLPYAELWPDGIVDLGDKGTKAGAR